jgi:NAD(P)-dependent dehydrogenase (short-subunit alcohol dehydrogenase family)
LRGKVGIITGGDSGIGRAVAVAFAKEGADVRVVHLEEHRDAKETEQLVEQHGRKCLLLDGDVGDEKFCAKVVDQTLSEFGRNDILVNNAAEQHPQDSIEKISATHQRLCVFLPDQVRNETPEEGAVIVNTTLVTAYKGSPKLLDYSASKGAEIAFTRSLSQALADKGIRVNAVAPGPIWTPLIPSTFPKEEVATFGSDVPLGRAGQPEEIAPSYVFLASDDSSYMTGQILHPNGGTVVNG